MSCYTFLSGFQPSWPPSCYPQRATSFVGSECEPALGHFKSTLGASRITSTAYQVVVHMGLLVGVPAVSVGGDRALDTPSTSVDGVEGPHSHSHTSHLNTLKPGVGWRVCEGHPHVGRRGVPMEGHNPTAPPHEVSPHASHRTSEPLRSSMSWASYTPLHSSRIGRGAMCSPGFASRALLYRT